MLITIVPLVTIDLLLEYGNYVKTNSLNLKKLSSLSLMTEKNQQVWVKYTPEKSALIKNVTDILIHHIKYTTLPPSKTYIGEPISKIFIYFLPCCSTILPYQLIADLVTLISVLTAFPIVYFFTTERVEYRRFACVLFVSKRFVCDRIICEYD